MAIVAKYIVYYTKEIPQKLLDLVIADHNILLVKNGLSSINGYKCPQLSLLVSAISSRVDGQRIIALNALLDSLIKTGTLEHYAKT
jgi:hypothetical protein